MSPYHRDKHQPPFVATDLIIEYNDGTKGGIVLITRKNPPYGLALPGGFLEYELSPGANASKEAREETNLEVRVEQEDAPFLVRGNPHRDPRTRVLSLVYIVEGRGILRAGDDAASARLYSIDELRGLLGTGKFAFDHEDILRRYLIQKQHEQKQREDVP